MCVKSDTLLVQVHAHKLSGATCSDNMSLWLWDLKFYPLHLVYNSTSISNSNSNLRTPKSQLTFPTTTLLFLPTYLK